MTWQEVLDLLDEEILNTTKKLIAGTKEEFEANKAVISAYKHMKLKIQNQLNKEAKKHGEKRS